MIIPFNLTETVQGIDGKPFIIDTTEKEVFMSLPAELDVIFRCCHYANYADSKNQYEYILDVLNNLKMLQLCEEVEGLWILTQKGRLVQQEISNLTDKSRLMQ